MISDFVAPLVFAPCELTNCFACLECILQSSACSGCHFPEIITVHAALSYILYLFLVTTSLPPLAPQTLPVFPEITLPATLVSLLSRALVGIVL